MYLNPYFYSLLLLCLERPPHPKTINAAIVTFIKYFSLLFFAQPLLNLITTRTLCVYTCIHHCVLTIHRDVGENESTPPCQCSCFIPAIIVWWILSFVRGLDLTYIFHYNNVCSVLAVICISIVISTRRRYTVWQLNWLAKPTSLKWCVNRKSKNNIQYFISAPIEYWQESWCICILWFYTRFIF